MTRNRHKVLASYLGLVGRMLQGGRRISRAAAITLAVSPPVICALFARGPERWDLFERSGALTSAIGLLLASRRYLGRGVIEIAIIEQGKGSKSNTLELIENIHATKLGLAVSAFGTIIWGTGKYLQWWTFSYLIVWAAIAAFDAWRDFVRLRDAPIGDPPAEGTSAPGEGER